MAESPEVSIDVSHKGDVRTRSIDMAVKKIRHVVERCREPVERIELRLILEPNPARDRPAIAEATVDIQGAAIRAHVAAVTVDESIDLLTERLKRRIQRHEEQRHRISERRRTGDSGPGEWRHGDLPTDRPEYIDVPFDEREVRRQKAFDLPPMSRDEATFDLEQLGHDFYLFVDEAKGCDAIVHHGAEGDVELVRADPETGATPELSLTEAKEHLEASGDPYVFYREAGSARGNVLYRRYDGHYGLVTPADAAEAP